MKAIALIFLLFTPLIAQAEIRLGGVGIISESIYKDTDTQATILPNIAYQGEHVFVNLPEIGYRFLAKDSLQSSAVGLAYDSAKFDPDNSDDPSIQLLEDRDDSIMAFASYRIGPVSAKIAQDISSTHDGYYAKITVGYPIPTGDWKLIPSISYRYIDSKMSNHLFGVSQSDVTKSSGAVSAYDTGATEEVQYGVRAIYPFSNNTTFMLGVSYTKYNDKILNSPIIEDNSVMSILTGITFSF